MSASDPSRPEPTAARKPVSERQLAANRANAKKSTGPRTPEGKRRSSMNGLVHGLRARKTVLPDDDPRAFAVFARRIRRELAPRGAVEVMAAEGVIHAAWRLRRAGAAEEDLVANVLARYGAEAARVTGGKLVADAISGDPRAVPYLDLDEYAHKAHRALSSALRLFVATRSTLEARREEERRETERRLSTSNGKRRSEPISNPIEAELDDELNDVLAGICARWGVAGGPGRKPRIERSNPPGGGDGGAERAAPGKADG